MLCNPGVSLFVPFHKLDPSTGSQCIYFTQKGSRCGNYCSKSDDKQTIALRNTISATPRGTAGLELLRRYILLKCCRAGRHRYRIEDAHLLDPLALRWQDEICRNSRCTIPIHCADRPASYSGPLTPGAGCTTSLNTPAASPTHHQLNSDSVVVNSALRAETVVGSPCSTPTRSPIVNESGHQPIQKQTRYHLRSREISVPVKSTLTELGPIIQPLSEFQPLKPDSRPSDSVSSKMQTNLRSRDFETGSLYIFDRASSPGYVKIGWTAVSVPGRLQQWQKCGYTPNLIVSVDDVPHAQRVETLVHYELIKEWRRERMCKACSKSHQEWFEIRKERAMRVLRSWAEFMYEAQPYDPQGRLTSPGRELVERMNKNGEIVTGQRMLENFRASTSKILTPVMRVSLPNNPAQRIYQVKSEEAPRRSSPLLIENSSLSENITPYEGTAISEPNLLKEIPASKTEAQRKTEKDHEEVSPSQAGIVKQKPRYEQIVLPPSRTPVLRVSPQTIPSAQETELNLRSEVLKKAVLNIVDSLCNEVPMEHANSGGPGVGVTLKNEALLPVTLVA